MVEGGLLILAFAAPFFLLVGLFPSYLRALTRMGHLAEDAHKNPPTKVPMPAGPLLFAGLVVGEVAVAVGFRTLVPVAVAAGAGVAFAIGLFDDLYVLGGKTKPLLLFFAGLAFVSLAVLQPTLYRADIYFPILGDTAPHFIIYTILAVVAFPVVANAFNMMDAFNGEISWFALLTSLALLVGVMLRTLFQSGFSVSRMASVLPLVGVAGAFLFYNRYPSKAFDGDSGSLMFGAAFAGLAVTGGVEIAAIIAIVPAILNSFYTLSSVRGFVERRKIARPTYVGDDGLLHASMEEDAPNTLVRLVLLTSSMTEVELVTSIVALTAVACVFSVATSVLTWVF
jgi:UDP-N-acetylglucosamine--dolichyl-phosphate N-acetylglucosaminephosphotransferase